VPLARFGSLLRHPLTISLIAAAFAALLVPQFTRQWQDRQKEQEIKQRLLDQISVASTTAVRQGISLVNGQVRAAGGEDGEDPAAAGGRGSG
jgi:Tfp pilus assembly protein FimT